MLSIQMVIDLMDHHWKVVQRFFAMFAAIWSLTISSLAMEVFLFDIHVFVVKIPLATPVSCSTMATAIAEHARMFVSVKKM